MKKVECKKTFLLLKRKNNFFKQKQVYEEKEREKEEKEREREKEEKVNELNNYKVANMIKPN